MAIYEGEMEQLKQAKTLEEAKKIADNLGIQMSDEELDKACGGVLGSVDDDRQANIGPFG